MDGPRAGIDALDEAGRDAALWHYHLYDVIDAWRSGKES
jgi:hypothetical protein